MSAVFLAVLLAPAAEPEFAGRPLSAWAKQLKDDDTPRRRRAAALALGQLGAANPETLPVVLAALGKAARADASSDVRRQAVAGVAQQKPDDSTAAVDDLTEAVRVEKDAAVRLELATALGRFGPAAAPAVKPLADCLPDADPKLRAAAAAALGRIGADASAAAPALLARLTDADPGVKREAVTAVEPGEAGRAGGRRCGAGRSYCSARPTPPLKPGGARLTRPAGRSAEPTTVAAVGRRSWFTPTPRCGWPLPRHSAGSARPLRSADNRLTTALKLRHGGRKCERQPLAHSLAVWRKRAA